MSELLTSRISAIRGKHILVAVATGAAVAISLLLVWTTLAMWLDWQVIRGLPRWTRASLVVLELTALGWIIFTRIIRPIVRAPDDEDVALMIERHWPDFKTRLIASIQFSRPEAMSAVTALAASPALVTAMVRQTEELAGKTPLSTVVDIRALNKSLAAAAIVILVAIGLFLWSSPTSGILLQRAFLAEIPLPTKTHIESIAAESQCALGDPFKISATVSGYKPAGGRIDITYASGRLQQLAMDHDPADPDAYSVTLEAVPESFSYEVNIYDAHSDAAYVTALERPAIASIDLQQVYPAYTGLGTVSRQTGDLTLLAGSRLKLKVTSTKPLRSTPLGPGKSNYVLRFIDQKAQHDSGADKTHGDTVQLTRSPQNPRELTGDLDLPDGLNAFSIHLLDTDDLESKDTAVYPVEVIPDRPPTIRITAPDRKEELVTAQAQLDVGFLAEDDFLLGKITLQYKVDDGSIESVPLDLPPNLKTLRGHYLWDISKIPVPRDKPTLEGSVVEYWLNVEDTNNLSGPGRTSSDHYAARVVTRAEKQAEMMARSAETISGIKAASDDQDTLADKLGTRINEQPRGATTAPAKP